MSDLEKSVAVFRDTLERNGMAATSTTDGYILAFKREILSRLVLTGTQPYVSVGVQAPQGGIATVKLDRTRLQMELDANVDAPELIILYTHQPLSN